MGVLLPCPLPHRVLAVAVTPIEARRLTVAAITAGAAAARAALTAGDGRAPDFNESADFLDELIDDGPEAVRTALLLTTWALATVFADLPEEHAAEELAILGVLAANEVTL